MRASPTHARRPPSDQQRSHPMIPGRLGPRVHGCAATSLAYNFSATLTVPLDALDEANIKVRPGLTVKKHSHLRFTPESGHFASTRLFRYAIRLLGAWMTQARSAGIGALLPIVTPLGAFVQAGLAVGRHRYGGGGIGVAFGCGYLSFRQTHGSFRSESNGRRQGHQQNTQHKSHGGISLLRPQLFVPTNKSRTRIRQINGTCWLSPQKRIRRATFNIAKARGGIEALLGGKLMPVRTVSLKRSAVQTVKACVPGHWIFLRLSHVAVCAFRRRGIALAHETWDRGKHTLNVMRGRRDKHRSICRVSESSVRHLSTVNYFSNELIKKAYCLKFPTRAAGT